MSFVLIVFVYLVVKTCLCELLLYTVHIYNEMYFTAVGICRQLEANDCIILAEPSISLHSLYCIVELCIDQSQILLGFGLLGKKNP